MVSVYRVLGEPFRESRRRRDPNPSQDSSEWDHAASRGVTREQGVVSGGWLRSPPLVFIHRVANRFPHVIPAKAGIQAVFEAVSGPRLSPG